MDLFIIRHAEALPLGGPEIKTDADRPLTDHGREQSRALAHALVHLGIPISRLLASPLRRAQETADGIARTLQGGTLSVETTELLCPGFKRKKLSRFLESWSGENLGVVGHEPDLSGFVAWLIGGKKTEITLAKAGIACVRLDGTIRRRSGALRWLVSPQWYRTLNQNSGTV